MPEPHEVRRTPNGRVFAVVGDAGDGRISSTDTYHYREPHTLVIEIEGRYAGAKFNVPTKDVDAWEKV
jgi:hypothetical protein